MSAEVGRRSALRRRLSIPVALAAVGLVLRHTWITTRPLASGDWHWPSAGRLVVYSPWPSIWDSALGFSGENRFLDVFRFPVYAISGAIATAGGSWTLIEKVVYYLPFALLLPVAGWLLAREVLGATRWALVAPALFLANTYFLLQADGEIPLIFAEVIGCLTLTAFLRATRRLSIPWALATGLLLAATTALDIRPAFLTGLLMVGYVVVAALADPRPRLVLRRTGLLAASVVVFVATQSFWLLPYLTYHGHKQLPTPTSPDFNIITLAHGLAGVNATWSGGAPALLVQAPLNPLFMVLPLLAMLPLLRRRLTPELLWLALAAVICAFLAKTTTAPLGQVYQWIYLHVPGFKLFREGSKFLYPIALAYAVLVPAALQGLWADLSAARRRSARGPIAGHTALVAAALGLVAAVVIAPLVTLERGQLGSTTTPVAQPAAFRQVQRLLQADHTQGGVLWFGAPVFGTGTKNHRYQITSTTHPLTSLTGDGTATQVNSRDLLQSFCPALSVPFCYVTPGELPYLTSLVGASYVVAPVDRVMGKLPDGVTRAWLDGRLTGILGAPQQLGAAGARLDVWHLPPPPGPLTAAPAVAEVDAGPWALGQVLPALRALDVPATYRQTADAPDFPPAAAGLPDAVPVAPLVDGSCRTGGGPVAVMARSTAASLTLGTTGGPQVLGRLAAAPRTPGWSAYGPLGATTGVVGPAGTELGPCVGWSPLAAGLLAGRGAAALPVQLRAGGEVVRTPSPPAAGWVELRRLHDFGWRAGRALGAPVTGDGLFNLYHVPPAAAHRTSLTFTFSTLPWERRGRLLGGASLLLAVVALAATARSRRLRSQEVEPAEVALDSRAAQVPAAIGMVFLALAAVSVAAEWLGLPSRLPWTAVVPDPYRLDVIFGSAALAAFALSLATRALAGSLRAARESVAPAGRPPRLRARRVAAAAVATATSAMLVSSCGGGSQALRSAQVAAQPAPTTAGASLDEARVNRQARAPRACIADYTRALRSYPQLASAFAGRASCYLGGGHDAAAAVHDARRALSLQPGDPQQLLQLAAAERGIGDLGAAASAYAAAARAPSATVDVLQVAVEGLLALGYDRGARSAQQRMAGRFPGSATTPISAVAVAVAEGDEAAVAPALARGASLAATTDRSARAAVLAVACQRDVATLAFEAATTDCARAAAGSPDGSGALDDLSAAQLQLGQLGAALRSITAAIGAFVGSVGPNAQPAGVDGFGLANLHEARARMYVQAHQVDLAVADLRQAIRDLPPGSPDAAARLRAEITTARRSAG